jgi:K+-sensing histidine kinase KdpD
MTPCCDVWRNKPWWQAASLSLPDRKRAATLAYCDQEAAMFRRVLVAVDGSEAGAPALRIARALATEQQAQLRLVHVVD